MSRVCIVVMVSVRVTGMIVVMVVNFLLCYGVDYIFTPAATYRQCNQQRQRTN